MQATLFVTALCCMLPSSQLDKAPIDVRVGIVAYEDFREEYRQFESIFAEFTRRDPTLRFQLAVGSYGHVIHWLDRQQIDVAILTPGVFAGLLAETPNGLQPRLCKYLATVQLPAAKSHWASAARRTTTFADSYQSVCLVADESPIENIEDLQRLAKAKQLELLLVHPLSVSGRAVPEEALRRTGISLQELPTRFTYSHSQSIRMLHDPEHGAKRLAFVWDDAAGLNERLAEGVRRLAWPQLDEIVIPHDVVVVRTDFTHIKPLRKLFLTPAATQLRYRFVHLDNWQQLYGDVPAGSMPAMGRPRP